MFAPEKTAFVNVALENRARVKSAAVRFVFASNALDMSAKMHGSFVVNCNHGGGHCQAPPELQTAAWQFMKDHPWGVDPSPWASGIPSGIPDYCEIF